MTGLDMLGVLAALAALGVFAAFLLCRPGPAANDDWEP